MERHVGLSIEEITSHLLYLKNSNDTSISSSDEDDKALRDEVKALRKDVIQLRLSTASIPAHRTRKQCHPQSTD